MLAGKTFSNDESDGLTGTMTNRGAWTASPTTSGNVTIPDGYHNGSGYVNTSGVYTTGYNAGKANATLTLYATINPTLKQLYLPSKKTYKYVYGFHFTKPSKNYYVVMEYPKAYSSSSYNYIIKGYYEYNSNVCIQILMSNSILSTNQVSDGVCYEDYDDDYDLFSIIPKIYIYV